MNNVRELKPEPAEIKLIDPRRTSLVPAVPKRVDPAPIRKKRNFAQRAILFLACIGAGFSAGIIIAGVILIYCLQAGPV